MNIQPKLHILFHKWHDLIILHYLMIFYVNELGYLNTCKGIFMYISKSDMGSVKKDNTKSNHGLVREAHILLYTSVFLDSFVSVPSLGCAILAH